MKKNGVTKGLLYGLLAIGVAGQTGDLRGEGLWLNDGMLAPRSGEIFQTTRMGVGKGAEAFSFLMNGGQMMMSGGNPIGILFGIPLVVIGLPIEAAGVVLDEMIVSPLTDLVCLPYDLTLPNHGFYIRIVGEDGKPLPHVKIEGCVKNRETEKFSGETDDAGEFYVDRLYNLTGSFRATARGYKPWYESRDIKLDLSKKDPNGRIVIEYALQKSDLTGWQEKKGLTRNEVLAILPGKWSADSDTREYLSSELKWPPDREDRHCFTLEASGTVVSGVPECYHKAYCEKDPWSGGLRYSVWQLHRKGELEMAWNSKEPMSWSWSVRLSVNKSEYSGQDEYYLGEDERGIYLAPGLNEEFVGFPDLALKFRKVE